jgi:hypothetical protein
VPNLARGHWHARRIHDLSKIQTQEQNQMTKDNDILTSVYGKDAPDAAKFGKGAQSREQIQDAIDKRNASTDASKPRKYGER